MWKRLILWMRSETRTNNGRPELSPEVAAAALLVETALADGIYADIEERQILSVIREAFEVTDETARDILNQGEMAAEGAIGAHQFTVQVKSLTEAQRIKVIEGLYRVSFADGEKCPYEDAFVRHVASLLHVEDRDRVVARQRAETAADKNVN